MKRRPIPEPHGETFQSGGRLIGMAKHRQVRRRAQRMRAPKKPSAPRWKREPIDAWLDGKLRALGLGRLIPWIERACGVR